MRIDPNELLSQARDYTEDEEFTKAVGKCEEARQGFSDIGDPAGQLKAMADMVNALRHSYNYTGRLSTRARCRFIAEKMMHLYHQHKDKTIGQTHLVRYRYAVALGLFDDWAEAARQIRLAQDHFKGSEVQRADWQVHLGYALFKANPDKREAAEDLMVSGLAVLRNPNPETDPYSLQVWLSGAYMKLAEVFRDTDHQTARQFLSSAGLILDENPDLKIRAHEYGQLLRRFHAK